MWFWLQASIFPKGEIQYQRDPSQLTERNYLFRNTMEYFGKFCEIPLENKNEKLWRQPTLTSTKKKC